MNIAITGGAGFIGGHFIERFSHLFEKIVLFTRSKPKTQQFLESKITVINVSLMDKEQIFAHLNQIDVFINLAYDSKFPLNNMKIIKSLFEASKKAGVPKFIHLGSFSEYDPFTGGRMDESSRRNSSGEPYASIKMKQSDYLKESACFGTKVVILKPTIVLGKGGNWDFHFHKLAKCKHFYLPNGGNCYCNSIAIESVCDYIALLATRPDGDIFKQSLWEEFLISGSDPDTWKETYIKNSQLDKHQIKFESIGKTRRLHPNKLIHFGLKIIFQYFGSLLLHLVSKMKGRKKNQIEQEAMQSFKPSLFQLYVHSAEFKVDANKISKRLYKPSINANNTSEATSLNKPPTPREGSSLSYRS